MPFCSCTKKQTDIAHSYCCYNPDTSKKHKISIKTIKRILNCNRTLKYTPLLRHHKQTIITTPFKTKFHKKIYNKEALV